MSWLTGGFVVVFAALNTVFELGDSIFQPVDTLFGGLLVANSVGPSVGFRIELSL